MEDKNCYKVLNNGTKMPLFGLGTSQGHDEVMRKALATALEAGYRSFDTAYLYMNEEAIGEELHKWISDNKVKREDIFITSKLPAIGNRVEDIDKYLTKSLEKLKLKYLDLYLIHHPFGLRTSDDKNVFARDANGNATFDNDTDLENLWKGLEKEVDAGRVKAIGVSNFNISQLERIMKMAKYPPAVNQVEVHGYLQQNALTEKCHELGVAVVAYSPLGAPSTNEGGKISPILLENPVVENIGKKYGKTTAQVLLKFLLQRGIVVIPKSMTPERIISNFDVWNFSLTDEDIKELSKLDRGKEGRVYHFRNDFPGCVNHKEYPFHADA